MNDDVEIVMEGLSPSILDAYVNFGLARAEQGSSGIEWIFASDDVSCPPFCVARTQGRLIGLSANIPARIKLGAYQGTAFQAVDSFVAEEARGKRVFTRLATEFADSAAKAGVDVTWGFPNANAAPAWFGGLGWQNFGQVPFLVRPLNVSYLLGKVGIPGRLSLARERQVESTTPSSFGNEMDDLWARFGRNIGCAIVRDAAALNRRIFDSPQRNSYRVRMYGKGEDAALVVSRILEKHGATVAYILEAMGGKALGPLLRSEVGYLAKEGAELALAWCFPWSPNFSAYRSTGFFKLPERLRPVEINFGARALTPRGAAALRREDWYLSYLDSDGI